MHKAFGRTLRAGLILVILAGLGLTVHSLLSRGRQRAPTEAEKPTQVASRPGGVQPPAPREGPPAPEAPTTGDGQTPMPGPAEDQGPSPEPPRTDRQSVLVGFRTVVQDKDRGQDEFIVVGDTAIVHGKAHLYDIFKPVVDILLAGDEVDVQLGTIRVTAERAELDEVQGVVRFFEDVAARGEDFEVNTESVVFRADERTLSSDAQVRIQKDRIDTTGARTPAMVITGRGMSADLVLKKMVITTGVEARLYNVSQDFLAAGQEDTPGADRTHDVVITSDGKLLYEHIARKVTFFDDVVAVSAGKTLRCDQLTILLGEITGKDKLEVMDIVAQGDAELAYEDQVLRGDTLEWRNVTQMGVLRGEPATLTRADFEIRGRELTFYRVNNRFHTEGPGTLLWKAQDGARPESKHEQAEGAWDLAPVRLTKGDPFQVTWQTSMTYDAPGHVAVFDGQVVAQQRDSFLSCDELDIEFDQATDEIENFVARGQVSVRDQLTETGREALCDTLIWKPGQNTIELIAAEGETVNMITGRQTISSSHVVLDDANGTLDCPAAGRLTVSPAQKPGAGDAPKVSQGAIEVEWQKMMHFKQDAAPVAMFTGGVTARQSDRHIQAENLRVDFDTDMNPLRIAATENALIDVRPAKEPAKAESETSIGEEEPEKEAGLLPVPKLEGGHWRLACDAFSVLLSEELLTSETPGTLTMLEGDVATSSIAWQEGMRLDLSENFADFRGRVDAHFSDSVLKSEKLRLDFDEAKNLRHIDARQNVTFTKKEENAWQLESESAEAIFAAGNKLRQVIARDNVEVRDLTRTLTASRLQLFLEEVEGKTESVISRAIAEKDVRLKYQDRDLEARGDRLAWDRETDAYVLTGEPDAFLRRGRLWTSHDTIIVDRQTGKAEYPASDRPVRIGVGPVED